MMHNPWSLVVVLAIGFALAHGLAFAGPRVRSWLRSWSDRQWEKLAAAKGYGRRVWHDSRQKRRAMQRDYLRAEVETFAATPAGRKFNMNAADKKIVVRREARRLRAIVKQQQSQARP